MNIADVIRAVGFFGIACCSWVWAYLHGHTGGPQSKYKRIRFNSSSSTCGSGSTSHTGSRLVFIKPDRTRCRDFAFVAGGVRPEALQPGLALDCSIF